METIEELINFSIAFDDIPFKLQREIISGNTERVMHSLTINKWGVMYPNAGHLEILDLKYTEGNTYKIEAKVKYITYPFFYN